MRPNFLGTWNFAQRVLRGCALVAWMIAGASPAVGDDSKVQLWKGSGFDCNRTEIAFEAIRCRVVDVDVGALRPETMAVELRLVGRPAVTIFRTRVAKNIDGFVWDGAGKGKTRATFSVAGKAIVGDIISDDGKPVRMRRSSSDRLVVEFIDLAKLNRVEPPHRYSPGNPGVPGPAPAPAPAMAPASQSSSPDPASIPPSVPPTPPASQATGTSDDRPPHAACSDEGSMIDVLVLYTAKSVAEAGSAMEMTAQINKAEARTNWSFDDSGINTQIRVVKKASIAYNHDADGLNPILSVLTNPANSGSDDADTLDSVHALRTSVGADIVVLVVSQPTNANGLANPMFGPFVGVAFSPLAFAVITFQGLSLPDGYVFAHELGHVMGSNHEESSGGADAYSRGMSGEAKTGCVGWATIMAQPACAGCSALGVWSSPLIANTCGQTLGVADSKDNARSLNATRSIVSQFKGCMSP